MAPSTLLRLIWLASPALPVGGFSYSEGLEAAVDAGIVADEASAGRWLVVQLELVMVRSEFALVVQACRAWQAHDLERIGALNEWLRVTRESRELRLQAEQMGRSLVEWLRNGESSADPRVAQLAALRIAPGWPVAYALAATLAGAGEDEAALAFGFGWSENMTQAAIKAVPLGQAAAQRILCALAARLPGAVSAAAALDDDERQAFSPRLAILSSRHETQYSRLFRS